MVSRSLVRVTVSNEMRREMKTNQRVGFLLSYLQCMYTKDVTDCKPS